MTSLVHRLGIVRARMHRAIFTLSRGRLLRRWGGLPVLVLTVTGRKSGRPRSTMLVVPAQLDGDPVVVASAGGAPLDPQWYRNLRQSPRVETLTGGRRETRIAERVTGPAAERLWEQIVVRAPAYGRYRAKADREIPLVVLRRPPGD